MTEYISREEVISVIANMQIEHHYDAVLLEVADKINELKAADVQPINRWISVKDRLPEPEKEVLVWYRYTWGAGFTAYRFGISKWYSYIKRWYEGCLPKDFEVLYWQPLPEPPRAVK